jgi:ribosomal 30S subunit maturation factor RimM
LEAQKTLEAKIASNIVRNIFSVLPPPEEGEYYWTDLIGLSVVNTQGETLGVVSELLPPAPPTMCWWCVRTRPNG